VKIKLAKRVFLNYIYKYKLNINITKKVDKHTAHNSICTIYSYCI